MLGDDIYKSGDKVIEYIFVYQKSGCCHANLSLVAYDAAVGLLNSLI